MGIPKNQLKSVRDYMLDPLLFQKREEKRDNYIPLDLEVALNEHGEYVQSGETCRIDLLKDHMAWMRGFVAAWFGWPSSGKSMFTAYLMMVKSIRDDWRWGIYSPEEMNAVVENGKLKIKADRIYKNLAWIYSGRTWNKRFAEKNNCEIMTFEEERESLEFVTKHFFVIHPTDRTIESILENFQSLNDKFGMLDGFLIDPWNVVKMDNMKRADEMLTDAFIDVKQFAMLTNSCFNIISHPRSLKEVKTSQEKHAPYKVVNQFMQAGGAAWNNKMDVEYSIERPNSHLEPRDPFVNFHNLKQRQFEIVGVNKGTVGDQEKKIEFDFKKRRYYFDGVDIISGELKSGLQKQAPLFTKETAKDDLPF